MRRTRAQLHDAPFGDCLTPCPACGGGWWVEAVAGPGKGTYGWVAHEEGCLGPRAYILTPAPCAGLAGRGSRNEEGFAVAHVATLADLQDSRRDKKPWLPADDRDVTNGLVVADSHGKPACVRHDAMNRVDPYRRLYRCSEQYCGVGAELT